MTTIFSQQILGNKLLLVDKKVILIVDAQLVDFSLTCDDIFIYFFSGESEDLILEVSVVH